MRTIDQIVNDKKPVIMLGSCASMHNIIESCQAEGRNIIGVVDEDYRGQTTLYGLTMLDPALLDSDIVKEIEFFVATGWNPGTQPVIVRNNQKRQGLIQLMQDKNLQGASLIHPSAVISPGALIGRNVRIGALSMITHGAVIHNHVNIKEQCYISHGCIIGQDSIVQIGATVTGDVDIGNQCYIGVGATIMKRNLVSPAKMRIGNNVLVHPRVTVYQALPDNAVASLNDKKFSRVF